MILVALAIGIVLIVASVRGQDGALFSALGTDVPGFVIWGAAILAVGAIGYVPGLKSPARGLLALVLVVLALNNYQNILAGFGAAATPATPKANPGATTPAGTLGSAMTAGGAQVSSAQGIVNGVLADSGLGSALGELAGGFGSTEAA